MSKLGCLQNCSNYVHRQEESLRKELCVTTSCSIHKQQELDKRLV